MIGFSRRSILGGAATAIAAWPARSLALSDPRSADSIVRNARVITMESGLAPEQLTSRPAPEEGPEPGS